MEKSKIYSFRLRHGRDDNIIALLDSAPEQERSVLIRQALRALYASGQGSVISPFVPVAPAVKKAAITAPKISPPKEQEFKLPPTEPKEDEVDLDSKMDALINNFF